MALRDEVEARFSSQLLTELTLRDRPNEDAQDTDVLDQACTSVENLFPTYAGVAYDSTNGQHIEAASECVVQMLRRRGGTRRGVGDTAWDRIVELLRDVAQSAGGRKRVMSRTSGTSIRSTDRDYKRPVFDDEALRETILNPPVETSDDS